MMNATKVIAIVLTLSSLLVACAPVPTAVPEIVSGPNVNVTVQAVVAATLAARLSSVPTIQESVLTVNAVPSANATRATPIPSATPTLVEAKVGQGGKVYLGTLMILDPTEKDLGCFDAGSISYSPTKEYFLVVLNCFEGDNDAFLFRADGSDKRRITGKWDYINYHDFEWAADGQSFVYQRINDCCVVPPPDAPPAGRVRYIVRTGEKTLLSGTTTLTAQTFFLRPSCGMTYNAQAGKPIEVQYGAWGVNGAKLAEDNKEHLTVKLLIDNQLVSGQRQFDAPMSSIPCGNVLPGSYWIVHATLIDSLSPGKHTIEVIYTFDQEITDGYDSDNDGALDRYEANKPIRQTYTILVS
jgi:hypothetical protein